MSNLLKHSHKVKKLPHSLHSRFLDSGFYSDFINLIVSCDSSHSLGQRWGYLFDFKSMTYLGCGQYFILCTGSPMGFQAPGSQTKRGAVLEEEGRREWLEPEGERKVLGG